MWVFGSYATDETIQQSKLVDFFHDHKKEEKSSSLIREALQNAIDAKHEKHQKVKVKITTGTLQLESDTKLFEDFNRHVESANSHNGTEVKPITNDSDIPYILIEDFNTTGLDGGFDKDDEKNKGSLIKFWWEEGISNDNKKGSGGSHGVGKEMLAQSSESKAFLAYSKTQTDELFLGFSRIGQHKKDGNSFREYARFGKGEDEAIFYPYSSEKNDEQKIDSFINLLNIKKRDTTKTGTSIFIFNIDLAVINFENIAKRITENFYLPILKDILEVELIDNQKGYKRRIFNKNSLENIKNIEPIMLNKISMASFLIKQGDFYNTNTEFKFSKGDGINENAFTNDNLKNLQNDYHNFKTVKLKFNIELYPTGATEENGYLEIAIKKNNKEEKPFYDVFRGEVRIMDETLRNNEKASAILNIPGHKLDGSTNILSDFLKYCEDPGHKNWKGRVNRPNEQKRFSRVWQKDTVRFLVKNLINMLEGISDEKIEGLFENIFTIRKPVNEVGADDTDDSTNNDRKPPDKPIESTPLFTIDRLSKEENAGFKIKPGKRLLDYIDKGIIDESQKVIVKVAYQIYGKSKANWLRSGEIDINLEDKRYEFKGANCDLNQHKNTFELGCNVKEPVTVIGFDPNKELHVNIDEGPLKKIIKETQRSENAS